MKKLTSKLGLFALAGALAFGSTSCKKELVTTETTTSTNTNTTSQDYWSGDAVYNRTVDYSVVVTAQADGSFRSPQGVSGATVAVAVAGEVATATTDANGVAAFSGLTYGIASVSVSASGHASAHFTADLQDSNAGDNTHIDNHTNRTASTIVTMIPTSGLGTATVMGTLEMENLINNGANSYKNNEKTAPVTAKITGKVDFSSGSMGAANTNGYLVHSGVGNVSELYVEGIKAAQTYDVTTVVGSSSNDGDEDHTYTFTVPATAYGLTVELVANDFTAVRSVKEDDFTTTTSTTDDRIRVTDYNHTYSVNNNTWSMSTYPGETYVWDLIYK
ncbi:MAG: hypothetical protein GY810_11065 [Aureispira sp.]|nr:hypothetical protein [Aureispira sp.]